jgi:regulatory protein SWI5
LQWLIIKQFRTQQENLPRKPFRTPPAYNMLSTNTTSSIQRRRTQHRRLNSTPAAFEAPQVRSLPANIQQQRQRSGMSLDLRGLNLDMPQHGSFPGQKNTGSLDSQYFQQEHSTVSNTNIGQIQQHTMQVAHTHSQAQPGHQDAFLRSPVQQSQQSLTSPRTPHRSLRGQSPQQPSSPTKPPTEEQMKELQEHIQSVYGSYGQVFINILPTPTATPQKPAQLPSHVQLEAAPLPPVFTDMSNINFEPTSSAMTFDFDNPDADMGYESSSYYTSDALSPSPMSSPHQKTVQMFLEKIEENPSQELIFSQTPALYPTESTLDNQNGFSMSMEASMSQSSNMADLEMDASIEYTGISPEEVQRYISEQDPTTNKWMCMYPECGKTFGRRENIRSHVQTHLGDRQYRCNHCSKCFVRQHDLKRHAKIHSGTKPYKCPCSAEFARQDALTRHRQRGMCVGGFPDAVRRQAKRGRPKKNRPELEERAEKANKTRRKLASAASSICASSPPSDTQSPPPSFTEYELLQPRDLPSLLPETSNFGDHLSSATDPFRYVSTAQRKNTMC